MINIIITSIIILGIIIIVCIICYTTYKLNNNNTLERLHNLIHSQNVTINDVINNLHKNFDYIKYIENINNNINETVIKLQQSLIE